jgi:hypothetical protein
MGRAGGKKELSFDIAMGRVMSHVVSFPAVEETTFVAKVGEVVVSSVAGDADQVGEGGRVQLLPSDMRNKSCV